MHVHLFPNNCVYRLPYGIQVVIGEFCVDV